MMTTKTLAPEFGPIYAQGKALGRKFEVGDLTSALRTAARNYAYASDEDYGFMADMAFRVRGGKTLSDPQAKGVLNCLMAQGRRDEKRDLPWGAKAKPASVVLAEAGITVEGAPAPSNEVAESEQPAPEPTPAQKGPSLAQQVERARAEAKAAALADDNDAFDAAIARLTDAKLALKAARAEAAAATVTKAGPGNLSALLGQLQGGAA